MMSADNLGNDSKANKHVKRNRITVSDSLPFLVATIFYFVTMSPTIGMGDPALLINDMLNLQLSTHANTHNITLLFGWLLQKLPVGTHAFRANLSSVLLGGLTIGLFYNCLKNIFRSKLVALYGGLICMVSHSMWWHSTIVEAYAANAGFVVAALFLISEYQKFRRPESIAWLAALSGLALFQHLELGVLLIACGILTLGHLCSLSELPLKVATVFLGKIVASFFLGMVPFLMIFTHDVIVRGGIAPVVADLSGGNFTQIMFKGSFWFGIKDVVLLWFQQFPSPALLLIAIGLPWFFVQWNFGWASFAIFSIFALDTAFFMFFNTWDRFAHLLPSFLVMAFWGAAGFELFLKQVSKRSVRQIVISLIFIFSVAVPPILYAHIPDWAQDKKSLWYQQYNNEGTSNLYNLSSYLANPNKRHFTEVDDYVRVLFYALPQNAIYVDSDCFTYYQIDYYYRRIYKQRPDLSVLLINSWGFDNWGLSQPQFNDLVVNAFQYDRPLYFSSLAGPFTRFIERASVEKNREYTFIQVPLSLNRWVYRMRTSSDSGLAPKEMYKPHVVRMAVGINFNTVAPLEKRDFVEEEAIMAKIEISRNLAPFLITFHWLSPEGTLYYASPEGLVAVGNTTVWNFLNKTTPMTEGAWRVEAIINGEKVGESSFRVGDFSR